MAKKTELNNIHVLRALFCIFLAEQFPYLAVQLNKLWPSDEKGMNAAKIIEGIKPLLFFQLEAQEITPLVSPTKRAEQEFSRVEEAILGFFRRAEIKSSLSKEEKLWMLKGIITTRAVDNCLKKIFVSGEIKYQEKSFQGKGFRSLGQEAIYASALRLHRGKKFSHNNHWHGDVVAPLIRDLGVVLAFTDDDIELALNAQGAKEGAPLNGKDLHSGDYERGVLIAAAPLAIATCTSIGVAFAAKLKNEKQLSISFIGDGGSSLGEWHEAINFAAVNHLPMIFCVQNNQTALSTPVSQQSKVRLFADKAIGYGMASLTIDGTDPEEIATSFAWAAEVARSGRGPVFLELVSMRMCGHAHHDDMLYLGHDPSNSFDLPRPSVGGYIDAAKYEQWAKRDPLNSYAAVLMKEKILSEQEFADLKEFAQQRCVDALSALKKRSWPQTKNSNSVFAPTAPQIIERTQLQVEEAPTFSAEGITYLEGIWRGLAAALKKHPEAYLLGEDVGAPYGNAFMLLKPLLAEYQNRIFNTPIAENAIIGACVGMALQGLRPIGEMQFNDFVASGFNQLVNNAAKLFYRTGQKVPMVMRMPWGGLRRAGPYHSQDTSPWFYRSFGLKIVVPSTPHDAIGLMLSAVADDNPVLYYEHIALYRAVECKQLLAEKFLPIPIGKAAFRRLGGDLALISYGAYVHKAMACAEKLAQEHKIECDVLDLRSLCPLDMEALFATVKRCHKVLLLGEDSRTGSILESIAAKIGEQLFSFLDGPVKVLGAQDTPVPYSPPLEDDFLLSNETIIKEAKNLYEW